jgi:hypothetical protein
MWQEDGVMATINSQLSAFASYDAGPSKVASPLTPSLQAA